MRKIKLIKTKQTYGTTNKITKLDYRNWLKFSTIVKQEMEDSYLQYKNLGLC